MNITENVNVVAPILGGICLLIGWWMNTVWSAVAKLSNTVETLQLNVAKNYVTKDEVERLETKTSKDIEGMFELLHRIEDKLDRKADKL